MATTAGFPCSRSTAPWPTGTGPREAQPGAGNTGLGEALCTQCGKASIVCPHAAIRAKVFLAEQAAKGAAHLQACAGAQQGLPAGTVDELPGGAGGLYGLRPCASKPARSATSRSISHKT